jgi:hypothetical protein
LPPLLHPAVIYKNTAITTRNACPGFLVHSTLYVTATAALVAAIITTQEQQLLLVGASGLIRPHVCALFAAAALVAAIITAQE